MGNKCPPGMEYGYQNNCQLDQDQKLSFYSAPDTQDNFGNEYAMNYRFNSQPTEQDYNYMLQYPQNYNYEMNNNYYQAPRNQERPEGDYLNNFSYKTYFGAPDKDNNNENLNQCEQGSTLGSRSFGSGDNLSSDKAQLNAKKSHSLWNSNNGSEDEKVFKQTSYPKAENCLKKQNQNQPQGKGYEDDKCLQMAFAQSDSIFLGI